ncbi:DUF2388 domain-containing protein [Pseudomonas sp. LPB0260]|uniref:DUF2388 domain-containing protein n=1 Tax=Pseudomonas sp. LPB0260 TaxID=2614442 RepID=UPI0015C2B41D|nr:DUF2388 domain-containing protein [Pseudomonas sp. LPB0260]QLC72961.1 DUF2388 domain-containing protein [Pseudomonas sp. LPB0260]QLC75735.1 DUF2388 domain-containing protein [Pseudomonas sp. LPB0260]
MNPIALFGLSALLLISGGAAASSFVGTTDAIGNALVGTLDASSDATSSLRDDKVVLDARDDAASFVASAGQIRGVHLEAALAHIRQQHPTLLADDLQLARAILSL